MEKENLVSLRKVMGEFLENRRKELGLSYHELRKDTGLHHLQIMSVMNGDKNYTIDSLLLLSIPLKLYIFFGDKTGKKDLPLNGDHLKDEAEKNYPDRQ